jgi:hypothetical protein
MEENLTKSARNPMLAREDIPGKLVLRHRDLGTALEPVGSTAKEGGSVRVQRLVAGCSPRQASLGGGVDGGGSSGSVGLALLKVLDDRTLEGELNQVEGEVPDDAVSSVLAQFSTQTKNSLPDPDDTDPSARDTSDSREPPVTVSGNDGGNDLGDTEGDHERSGRSLEPREAVRSGNEDKSLRNDGNLEINDHVSSVVVDIVTLGQGLDTESVLEEVGVAHDGEQSKGRGGEVETVADTVREHLGEVPRVGCL